MVAPMKVDPECRYGHGKLEHIPEYWGVEGIVETEATTEEPSMSFSWDGGKVYIHRVFRCPVCGYTEQFGMEF